MGIEQTSGHTADGSGLRGHSVGDIYPFIVVGVGEPVEWAVMWPDGMLTCSRFSTPHGAEDLARKLKAVTDAKREQSVDKGDLLCYGV